jgi:lipid-A-disaccharide synthase
MRLLISAGEASGDNYGAQLIEALRRKTQQDNVALRRKALEVFGLCGDRMRAAGCQTIVDARLVAVVGLAEVVSHLPLIYRKFQQLLRSVDSRHPDAAVLIDFPDFNLRLAKQLYRRGIPVIYYVSPQLWAWRPGRVEQVKRYVRKMLVIFPFEEQWYRERGVDAEFVGHPLAALPPPSVSREEFARQYRLDPNKQWIAVLPGSRRREVAMNLPDMAGVVRLLGDQFQYILPCASTLDRDWLIAQLGPDCARFVIADDARATLLHARAAVVASGTATVEAALLGTPFVMVYRVSEMSWKLGRRMVKVAHFGMPNLIANERVVPELVQDDFTVENLAARLREIIPDGEPRRHMIEGLAEVARRLRAGPEDGNIPVQQQPAGESHSAAERAADAVLAACATTKAGRV